MSNQNENDTPSLSSNNFYPYTVQLVSDPIDSSCVDYSIQDVDDNKNFAVFPEMRLFDPVSSDKDLEDLCNVPFAPADDDETLGIQDPFETPNQNERDNQITELLTAYVKFYKRKAVHSTICRYLILIPCLFIIGAFARSLFSFASHISSVEREIQVTDVISFITACISFISLIISLLVIITKYFFPENDEQYITKIVESIQKNDLETKRERANRSQSPSEDITRTS